MCIVSSFVSDLGDIFPPGERTKNDKLLTKWQYRVCGTGKVDGSIAERNILIRKCTHRVASQLTVRKRICKTDPGLRSLFIYYRNWRDNKASLTAALKMEIYLSSISLSRLHCLLLNVSQQRSSSPTFSNLSASLFRRVWVHACRASPVYLWEWECVGGGVSV